MTDATTANYGWTKPSVGADSNNWGTLLNGDLDAIDGALKSVANAVAAVFTAGMIMQWFGTAAACPTGWSICDGTNGTPDLRQKFIVGADSDSGGGGGFPAETAGGAASTAFTTDGHALSIEELAAHGHGVNDAGHTHGVADQTHTHAFSGAAHSHSLTDPGHVHALNAVYDNLGSGSGFNNAGGNIEIADNDTQSNTTGITIAAATATGSLSSDYTGITQTEGAATGVSLQNTGGGAAHSHTGSVATLPPYFALYYIMKLA